MSYIVLKIDGLNKLTKGNWTKDFFFFLIIHKIGYLRHT